MSDLTPAQPAKPPRFTIFARILLASLVPLIFISSMVLFAINKIVFDANASFARDETSFVARQVANKIETTLTGIGDLLALTSRNLAANIDTTREARDKAVSFLHALMDANRDIYNSWLVFEPGHFYPDRRFAKSYLRKPGGIVEIPAVDDAGLDDPERSPWYNVPLRTGEPFFYSVDYYDYGINEGRKFVGTIGYPVKVDGKTVGAVGMDIQYEHAFDFIGQWEMEKEREILLAADNGTILYATDKRFKDKKIGEVGYASAAAAAIEKALGGKQPWMTETFSPFRNDDALVYLHPLHLPNADHELYLLTDLPASVLYRDAQSAVQTILSASAIGLLLLLVSLYFTTRNLVRPIKRLTANADWIANGKLDVVMDDLEDNHRPRHEVDMLEISIKKMLSQLTQVHEMRLKAVEAEFARQRMEEASKAKERFFANMSHEIRTPMNVVLGMSELLLEEPLGEEARAYASDIRHASQSLLVVINNILDLSRIESGELPLIKVHFDLYDLLEDIHTLCHFLAKEKGLSFLIDMKGDVPKYVYGDNLRLKQVLMNLLENAIRFTREGFVRMVVSTDPGRLLFDIIDTGVGIKDADIPELFQPFRQYDTHKNRNTQGPGLGLAVSKGLLDIMGGSATLETVVGEGSAFRLTLPKVVGDASRLEAADPAIHIQYRPSAAVLVVDDSAINLNVAAGLLRLNGVTCETALSGAEAIEKIRQKDYDIVFMDHMMPEMDGVETTRKIRAMGGKFDRLVIIALTANAVIGTREMFLEAGMNDFLAKPIERPKLQAMLAKWIPKSKRIEDQGAAGEAEAIPLSPLLRAARSIEQLDVPLGLGRVVNQQDIYEQLLMMTRDMAQDLVAKLQAAYQADDLHTLRVETHGAKGAFANIGAMGLSAQAAELEKELREDRLEDFVEHFPDFIREVLSLGEKLKYLFEASR